MQCLLTSYVVHLNRRQPLQISVSKSLQIDLVLGRTSLLELVRNIQNKASDERNLSLSVQRHQFFKLFLSASLRNVSQNPHNDYWADSIGASVEGLG